MPSTSVVSVSTPCDAHFLATERSAHAADHQVIGLTVDAPLVGRLYENSGTFRYSVDTGGETL